jgi:iron complex transport system substrate-binding protein
MTNSSTHRTRSFAAVLAVALAFGSLTMGAAVAQDISIKHAQGETTVPASPKKVLVFDPASLDMLDALGVQVAGVPTGRLPGYLSKYSSDRYEKIGTLFEPDYEAVNAADPDLIIVGGRSRAKYRELAKIASTIDLSTTEGNFVGSVAQNLKLLGRIFGKQDQADALVAKLESSIANLRQDTAKVGKGLLVLTTGGKMSAYGPGSRFGALHSEFGIAPAVENLATTNHGQAISAEFIAKANPDWLFVIDRDAAIGQQGAAAKGVLDNELVAQTTAWKNGHVVYLDPVNWYLVGGGITSLQASVDQVAKAIAKK